MDKYESPTVEQVGGPNSHIEPNVVVAIPDVLFYIEAIAAAFIVAAAIETYYTTHHVSVNN